jgi:hypothetical protein
MQIETQLPMWHRRVFLCLILCVQVFLARAYIYACGCLQALSKYRNERCSSDTCYNSIQETIEYKLIFYGVCMHSTYKLMPIFVLPKCVEIIDEY